jgi:hypothetical protein
MTQTTSQADFASQFQSLTGKAPLRWQERLFHNHFVQNDIPAVIETLLAHPHRQDDQV